MPDPSGEAEFFAGFGWPTKHATGDQHPYRRVQTFAGDPHAVPSMTQIATDRCRDHSGLPWPKPHLVVTDLDLDRGRGPVVDAEPSRRHDLGAIANIRTDGDRRGPVHALVGTGLADRTSVGLPRSMRCGPTRWATTIFIDARGAGVLGARLPSDTGVDLPEPQPPDSTTPMKPIRGTRRIHCLLPGRQPVVRCRVSKSCVIGHGDPR